MFELHRATVALSSWVAERIGAIVRNRGRMQRQTTINTGFSSEIGTKLRDWAVGQAGGSCYSWAALSSNDSKPHLFNIFIFGVTFSFPIRGGWPGPGSRDGLVRVRVSDGGSGSSRSFSKVSGILIGWTGKFHVDRIEGSVIGIMIFEQLWLYLILFCLILLYQSLL